MKDLPLIEVKEFTQDEPINTQWRHKLEQQVFKPGRETSYSPSIKPKEIEYSGFVSHTPLAR